MQRQLYTAHLVRSDLLSEKTKHLEFRVAEMPCFDFIAGQFVSMKEKNHEGKEVTRAYSIASPPRPDNSFDICLNRVEHGFFSNYLCDLEIGADVKFHGPHGKFVLRDPVRDSIFIGTGTGIAPLRGMLHWLFGPRDNESKILSPTIDPDQSPEHVPTHRTPEFQQRYPERQFYLVFGNRYPPDIYYDAEFRALAAACPNFTYIPTLSRAGPPDWYGERGYVQQYVREIARGRTDMDAYICGLKDMVVQNRDLLINESGWDKTSVMFERFD
jgi:ferredoxin-NADP reductase